MPNKLPKSLDKLSEKELRDLLLQLDALNQKNTVIDKIETDDQLHQWILSNLGIDIPRVSVCPEHDAPFEFIADLFFDRVDAALVMASRGSGKSYLAALWNFLNAYWEPGAECLHVGAIEIQAKRVYSHVKQFQTKAAKDKVASTTISETLWNNGSKIEIITGSLSSVNGPHNQKVHRDEIELMDEQIYQESNQIERAKSIDGKEISSQTLITSTRKTSFGLMQKILDECSEAESEGRKAPYKVYKFCIKECIKNQPKCRVAFPNLPEKEKCICNTVQNSVWADESIRTFDAVCEGTLSKAEGFIPLDDAHKTFVKSSKAIWEAQQECRRPYVEDITLPEFSIEKNGIQGFELDPANGPIYMGIDFGGTSPHAVEWLQVLDFEIEVLDFKGDIKRLVDGTRIMFNELYRAEIGNNKLAELIVEQEKEYRRIHPKFRVKGRFADPQAKAARLDLKQHDPPLICSWPAVTRDREEHTKRMRDIMVDNLFVVDIDHCPMFIEEVESWNINLNRKKFDHAVDAGLYGVSNIFVVEKNRGKHQTNEIPGTQSYGYKHGQPNQFNDGIPSTMPSPLHKKTSKVDKWA